MKKTVLMLVLGLLAQTSWANKTFVYCSEASPSSFNPQLATDGPSFNASSHTIYDTLMKFIPGTTEIEPGLAESYALSKDGKKITFKLRQGVKFHSNNLFKPTRDFNADDVLFSFNRQRLKSHPYHLVSGGSYEYFNSMDMAKIIKDIKKVDDYTIEFILSQAEAPFLANMAMDFASILSAEYADAMMQAKTPEKVDTNPIGTGPYVFGSYVKDNIIRYTANKQYFRGAPKVDRLVFAITPDSSVRYQKLKAGECHLITEPNPADIPAMLKDKNIVVQEKEGVNIGYLAMNTKKPPLNNVLVRQAIAMALNREAYINAIYMGRAKVANSPLPPTIWSYNDKLKEIEHNTDKAKDLLKKAGVSNLELELWTMPVSRAYNPNGKKMGELMQADLAKIGIKAKIVTYDWPTYLDKSKRGEHQLIQFGWIGDNGDPDNFLHILLACSGVNGGSNAAKWCYQPYDQLVNQAKTMTDVKQRTITYKKAQEVFREQLPWVPLAYAKVYRAMNKNVTGYTIHPLGGDLLEKVDLK